MKGAWMVIAEGTPVGMLIKSAGSVATEIRMGSRVVVEEMQGIPVWMGSEGVCLLFVMALNRPAPLVKISGERQAGAFLLRTGDLFSLSSPVHGEISYQFKALEVIEVIPAEGDRCVFCRSLLQGIGLCCPGSEDELKGGVICHECAEAFGAISAGKRAVKKAQHHTDITVTANEL